MRKLAGAVLGLGLVLGGVSCGVDTDGAAENFVESTEAALGEELNDDQNNCLKELLKEYSDEEVVALGAREADAELTSEFTERMYNCLVMLGS